MRFTKSGTAAGTLIVPLDHLQNPFAFSVAVTVAGGSAQYTVQHTLDDPPDASINWWDFPADPSGTIPFAGASDEQWGTFGFATRALALTIHTITAGATVTMTVIQPGPR